MKTVRLLFALPFVLYACGSTNNAVVSDTSNTNNGLSDAAGLRKSAEAGPGFTDAYIDFSTVNEILINRACQSVRFYNVIAANGNGSVMAIGIDKDGNELNQATQNYKKSDGISNNRVRITTLPRKDAVTECERVRDGGLLSYSTYFTRGQLEQMMGDANCTCFVLRPWEVDISGNAAWSKEISVAKIADNRAVPCQENPASSSCAEPCPVLCGDDGLYLNRGTGW